MFLEASTVWPWQLALVLYFSVNVNVLVQTTITGGTWSDTYSGWTGDSQSFIGSLNTYHGPFDGSGFGNDIFYTFSQSFTCDEVLSDVTVSYYIYFCETEGSDRVEATISTSTDSDYQEDDLDENRDDLDDTILESTADCDSDDWEELIKSNAISLNNIAQYESFTVEFRTRVSYNGESIVITNINIACS